MPDPNKSPAVRSYNADKARRRTGDEDALDQGLEDTFPASDPVSATQLSTATVVDTKVAPVDEEYPLVEEALRSTGELRHDNRSRVRALRRDALRLSDHASEVASGAVAATKSDAKTAVQSMGEIVRQHPLTAVGIVAAVAWLLGATR